MTANSESFTGILILGMMEGAGIKRLGSNSSFPRAFCDLENGTLTLMGSGLPMHMMRFAVLLPSLTVGKQSQADAVAVARYKRLPQHPLLVC